MKDLIAGEIENYELALKNGRTIDELLQVARAVVAHLEQLAERHPRPE